MLANATNRVYGLGLTAEEFWTMTPRELSAHQELADANTELLESLHAGIQATLHNAHWPQPKGKAFLRDMFMPGYQPSVKPDESWRTVKLQMDTMRKATETEKRALDLNAAAFHARAAAASHARANGASRGEIQRIMEGK